MFLLMESEEELQWINLNGKIQMTFQWPFVVQSSLVQNQIADATTKVGQPKLAIIRIQNMLIPLPPLSEQKSIVAKLEEILPLCERLK